MRRYRYPTHLNHKAARAEIEAASADLTVDVDLSRNDWFSLDGSTVDLFELAMKLSFSLDPAP